MLTRNDICEAIRMLLKGQMDYLTVIWGVEDFNKKFKVDPNPELYSTLICEETNEWLEEFYQNGYTPNLLKETVDVIYVLEGMLAANPEDTLEISLESSLRLTKAINIIKLIVAPVSTAIYPQLTIMVAFDEVQRSNLSKLGADGNPVYREADNKILKGPNYQPADISQFVRTGTEEYQHLKV